MHTSAKDELVKEMIAAMPGSLKFAIGLAAIRVFAFGALVGSVLSAVIWWALTHAI